MIRVSREDLWPAPFPQAEAASCPGLIEQLAGKDRCRTCRGCREWLANYPMPLRKRAP